MTSLASANDEATLLAADAFAALLPAPEMETAEVVDAILTAVIPHIRADERERCLQAIRDMPMPLSALYSAGYRAGHTAAREGALGLISDLPTHVALD